MPSLIQSVLCGGICLAEKWHIAECLSASQRYLMLIVICCPNFVFIYRDCTGGAMFELYFYDITVFKRLFPY